MNKNPPDDLLEVRRVVPPKCFPYGSRGFRTPRIVGADLEQFGLGFLYM